MIVDQKIKIAEVKKILVVATHSIGDVVHSLHTLHSLKLNFPHAEFGFLGYEYTKELHEWLGFFQNYDFYPPRKSKHGMARLAELKKLVEVLKKVFLLRKRSYDLAFILPGGFEHALLAYLTGVPHRIGSNSDGRGFLLTGHKKLIENQPNYELMMSLLDCIPGATKRVYFQKESQSTKKLKETLPKKYFIVAPTASLNQKMWNAKKFIELVNHIKQLTTWEVLYLGSGKDKEYIEQLVSQTSGINLAGEATLTELLAVLQGSKFFLGNNSGLCHIAGLTGIPVAVLVGPSNPILTKPYSKKSLMIMSPEDVPDHLREAHPYKEKIDVNKISVKMAFEQLEKNNFL